MIAGVVEWESFFSTIVVDFDEFPLDVLLLLTSFFVVVEEIFVLFVDKVDDGDFELVKLVI